MEQEEEEEELTRWRPVFAPPHRSWSVNAWKPNKPAEKLAMREGMERWEEEEEEEEAVPWVGGRWGKTPERSWCGVRTVLKLQMAACEEEGEKQRTRFVFQLSRDDKLITLHFCINAFPVWFRFGDQRMDLKSQNRLCSFWCWKTKFGSRSQTVLHYFLQLRLLSTVITDILHNLLIDRSNSLNPLLLHWLSLFLVDEDIYSEFACVK